MSGQKRKQVYVAKEKGVVLAITNYAANGEAGSGEPGVSGDATCNDSPSDDSNKKLKSGASSRANRSADLAAADSQPRLTQ